MTAHGGERTPRRAICFALGFVLAAVAPAVFGSVTGDLMTGSAGSMTITSTAFTLFPDPSASPAGPPWDGEVANLTNLKFASCPSGVLGTAGCLNVGPFSPAEAALIGSLSSSTTLPLANFLVLSGNGVTHAVVAYTLTSIGPGSSSTNCASATNVGDSCSISAGHPLVLTKSAAGTTITLPLAGTVTDALGAPTDWQGALVGSIAGTTPAQVQTALAGTSSFNVPVSGDFLVPLVQGVDLSIAKTDGVASAVPGTSVTYTITVSNGGTTGVTGASVADSFPAAITSATWTCTGSGGGTCAASGSGDISDTVDLPSAASVTYTVQAAISPSATGTLTNTATVTAPNGVTDVNPANNSATDTDTLTPEADVSVAKSGPATIIQHGIVVYEITVGNAGPSAAQGVALSDTLPAGTTFVSQQQLSGPPFTLGNTATSIDDTIATLAAGASATFRITVATSAAVASGTVLANTATVSATTADPNPDNDTSTAVTTVGAPIPTLSPAAALGMALALLGAGLFALRRS